MSEIDDDRYVHRGGLSVCRDGHRPGDRVHAVVVVLQRQAGARGEAGRHGRGCRSGAGDQLVERRSVLVILDRRAAREGRPHAAGVGRRRVRGAGAEIDRGAPQRRLGVRHRRALVTAQDGAEVIRIEEREDAPAHDRQDHNAKERLDQAEAGPEGPAPRPDHFGVRWPATAFLAAWR